MRRNFLKITAVIVIAVICAGLIFFVLAAHTPLGWKILIKPVMGFYIGAGSVTVSDRQGALSGILSLHDLRLENIANLPPGSYVAIQRLDLKLESLSPGGLKVFVFNGLLRIPGAEPVVFYGSYSEDDIDLYVYCRGANIAALSALMPNEVFDLSGLTGWVADVDLRFTGSLNEPAVEGVFSLPGFRFQNISGRNFDLTLDLKLPSPEGNIKPDGRVTLLRGGISAPRTALVIVRESSFDFSGDFSSPFMDLRGYSVVDRVNIDISLKGTIKEPALSLQSTAKFSQDYLLLMIATGRRWRGMERFGEGAIASAEIIYDALDYFLFGGSAGSLARKLGFDDIAIRLDSDSRGVQIRKDVGGGAYATYEISHRENGEQCQAISHKAGVGYSVTDNIKLEAGREVTSSGRDPDSPASKSSDSIGIRYKREF